MKETKEKYPGLNGETFLIRVAEMDMIKVAEINLVYVDGEEVKMVALKHDQYPIETSTEKILELTKSKLEAITIIKREVGVDLLKKKK